MRGVSNKHCLLTFFILFGMAPLQIMALPRIVYFMANPTQFWSLTVTGVFSSVTTEMEGQLHI